MVLVFAGITCRRNCLLDIAIQLIPKVGAVVSWNKCSTNTVPSSVRVSFIQFTRAQMNALWRPHKHHARSQRSFINDVCLLLRGGSVHQHRVSVLNGVSALDRGRLLKDKSVFGMPAASMACAAANAKERCVT